MRPLGDTSSLTESIRQVGLLNPISITKDNWLIAGLHRLKACKALGFDRIPAVVFPISREEAQIREIDENLIRNDLSVLERAEHYHRRKELYERLHPERRHGGNRGNQYTGGKKCQDANLRFCQTAASVTRHSASTINRLVRIAKTLSPDVRNLLRDTDWAHNQQNLTKLCRFPCERQKAIALKIANGGARTLHDAIAAVHQEEFSAKACSVPLEGKEYRLLHGDFRKVGVSVESGSVDLILTDAPYEAPHLCLFKPFSEFAHRVLKDGGSVLCMIGPYHLPRVLDDLSLHLQYHWLIPCLYGGAASFIPNRRVNAAYKPFIWFTKGEHKGRAVRDVIQSGKRDKRFHPHGQSEDEFAHLIELFTLKGETVMDCFMGGGTVAAAALKLDRKFVGIEKERKHVETTRRRISQLLEVKKG